MDEKEATISLEAPRADAKPGPYYTALAPEEEQQFQSWVKDNDIPWREEPKSDYDMRGYWKDVASKGKSERAENGHFPDTYKTPYHQTFSRDSRYAIPEKAPAWHGKVLVAKDGTVIADERPKPKPSLFRSRNAWKIPLPKGGE